MGFLLKSIRYSVSRSTIIFRKSWQLVLFKRFLIRFICQIIILYIYIFYVIDLRNTDLNSEVFIRKLHRAHEALSQSDGSGTSSVKTLSASFGIKWPYKRTMSAPASIIPRHELRQGQ